MEYVYLNNEKIIKQDITELYNNITFITNKKNNLFMIDDNITHNLNENKDLLEFTPEVDLAIIDKNNPIPDKKINKMLNTDTIISKIFNNNLIYIEDQLKNQRILITNEYVYLIEGSGINTEISVTKLD